MKKCTVNTVLTVTMLVCMISQVRAASCGQVRREFTRQGCCESPANATINMTELCQSTSQQTAVGSMPALHSDWKKCGAYACYNNTADVPMHCLRQCGTSKKTERSASRVLPTHPRSQIQVNPSERKLQVSSKLWTQFQDYHGDSMTKRCGAVLKLPKVHVHQQHNGIKVQLTLSSGHRTVESVVRHSIRELASSDDSDVRTIGFAIPAEAQHFDANDELLIEIEFMDENVRLSFPLDEDNVASKRRVAATLECSAPPTLDCVCPHATRNQCSSGRTFEVVQGIDGTKKCNLAHCGSQSGGGASLKLHSYHYETCKGECDLRKVHITLPTQSQAPKEVVMQRYNPHSPTPNPVWINHTWIANTLKNAKVITKENPIDKSGKLKWYKAFYTIYVESSHAQPYAYEPGMQYRFILHYDNGTNIITEKQDHTHAVMRDEPHRKVIDFKPLISKYNLLDQHLLHVELVLSHRGTVSTWDTATVKTDHKNNLIYRTVDVEIGDSGSCECPYLCKSSWGGWGRRSKRQ